MLAVALPALRRGAREPGRADAALAVFEDQLAEVGRDEARGLVTAAEADAARAEIKRRMLHAARAGSGGPGRARALPVLAAAALIPLGGGALYLLRGQPDVPSLPFAERTSERAAQAEVADLAAELRRRLEADPTGGPTEGWVLLARTHMGRGELGPALAAFEVVAARDDAPAGALTQAAEALVMTSEGAVTAPALALIERAEALDPTIPAAPYYRALALSQSGDAAGARDLLLARLAEARGPEPWTEPFLAEVNRLGAALGLDSLAPRDVVPGVAEIEDMTPEDRQARVRQMVDGLAERLADAPDDLDGWLRLGQARAALGEADAAAEAYRSALMLMPPDDPRREGVTAAVAELEG